MLLLSFTALMCTLSLCMGRFPFLGINSSLPLNDKNNRLSGLETLFPHQLATRFTHSDPNSWFGYSLSAYVSQESALCLIGAPKYQDTGRTYRVDLLWDTCSIMPVATSNTERRQRGTPEPGGQSPTFNSSSRFG
ncbi:hypothetical protein Ciccas_014174 [Cichlidogyrus casuarinus]|uniref:Secreted protein n=1 Tax=Cichlidogyrus casuarinus TaxID=1844966 RepID=A0ABD2PLM9_9PLAT